MRIGELADRAGVTAKTVRYYESIGLLESPQRSHNGYRDYPDDAEARLRFIRDAQASGLTLQEIGSIVAMRATGERSCDHVVHLLERHLAELDRHIANLGETRRTLAAMTERAKGLDPADCVDPIRCQTIEPNPERVAAHTHGQPHAHHH